MWLNIFEFIFWLICTFSKVWNTPSPDHFLYFDLVYFTFGWIINKLFQPFNQWIIWCPWELPALQVCAVIPNWHCQQSFARQQKSIVSACGTTAVCHTTCQECGNTNSWSSTKKCHEDPLGSYFEGNFDASGAAFLAGLCHEVSIISEIPLIIDSE